jgi:uracil phosphoribosyltransferase
VKVIQYLRQEGDMKELHIVCAIACTVGLEYVLRAEPKAIIWCGDIDDELDRQRLYRTRIGRRRGPCIRTKAAILK